MLMDFMGFHQTRFHTCSSLPQEEAYRLISSGTGKDISLVAMHLILMRKLLEKPGFIIKLSLRIIISNMTVLIIEFGNKKVLIWKNGSLKLIKISWRKMRIEGSFKHCSLIKLSKSKRDKLED